MMNQYGLLAIVATAFIAGVLDALPAKQIVGGTEAVLGEFPYHASLRFQGEYFCAGSIISSRHVLTAAHCVASVIKYPYTDFLVSTGSVQANGGQNYTIKSAHYHSQFTSDGMTTTNDIAIITLNEDIIFDDKQKKVSLPSEPTPSGVIANVTGWGSTEAFSPIMANNLQKINVTTVTTAQCRPYYGKNIITVKQICAGNSRGIGICHADSGGALVHDNILIGIISFGNPCGTDNPDVYTNVYEYLDWIQPYIESIYD